MALMKVVPRKDLRRAFAGHQPDEIVDAEPFCNADAHPKTQCIGRIVHHLAESLGLRVRDVAGDSHWWSDRPIP